MSFNDYKREVKKEMSKYGYTKEQLDKFLSTVDADDVLRKNYTQYSEKGTAGCEPIATASCLDMLYE